MTKQWGISLLIIASLTGCSAGASQAIHQPIPTPTISVTSVPVASPKPVAPVVTPPPTVAPAAPKVVAPVVKPVPKVVVKPVPKATHKATPAPVTLTVQQLRQIRAANLTAWFAHPTFTCPTGRAPGWLNEQGIPTSCVGN